MKLKRTLAAAKFALIVAAFPALDLPSFAQQSAGGRAASAPVPAARSAEPKTVIDFYLALPNKISAIAGANRRGGEHFASGFSFSSGAEKLTGAALARHRRSLIKTEDVANGYLKLEGMWEGWVEIAIFKKADGTYLVAVSQVGCGPGCEGGLMFLSHNKGRWTDVTDEVFPADPFSADGYFQLPRTGTTIRLLCGADNEGLDLEPGECRGESVLGTFKWDRNRFIK